MLTVKIVVDGTALDLLTSIAQNIKNDVENFLTKKVENGSLESFRDLTPFAQRIEFFEDSTDYKIYREALRQWILYGQFARWGEWNLPGWGSKLDPIETNAAKRAGQVRDLGYTHAFAERDWEEPAVKNLMEMRRVLLEQNPILSDPKIDIPNRRRLMNLALRGNKTYQYYQEQFDRIIKRTISSLITQILLESHHVKNKNYAAVMREL